MFTPTPVPAGCFRAGTAMPPTLSPSTPSRDRSLLCNGVIVFDDMGEILPGGRVIPPHGPAHVRLAVAA